MKEKKVTGAFVPSNRIFYLFSFRFPETMWLAVQFLDMEHCFRRRSPLPMSRAPSRNGLFNTALSMERIRWI